MHISHFQPPIALKKASRSVAEAKKKKKGLFPVSRPTLFFGADPKLFFNFQKKIQNKRRKMAKKSSKSVERFKSYKKLQK